MTDHQTLLRGDIRIRIFHQPAQLCPVGKHSLVVGFFGVPEDDSDQLDGGTDQRIEKDIRHTEEGQSDGAEENRLPAENDLGEQIRQEIKSDHAQDQTCREKQQIAFPEMIVGDLGQDADRKEIRGRSSDQIRPQEHFRLFQVMQQLLGGSLPFTGFAVQDQWIDRHHPGLHPRKEKGG